MRLYFLRRGFTAHLFMGAMTLLVLLWLLCVGQTRSFAIFKLPLRALPESQFYGTVDEARSKRVLLALCLASCYWFRWENVAKPYHVKARCIRTYKDFMSDIFRNVRLVLDCYLRFEYAVWQPETTCSRSPDMVVWGILCEESVGQYDCGWD